MSQELTPEQQEKQDKENQEVMKRFYTDFDTQLFKCMETGEPFKMAIQGKFMVHIDIYSNETAKAMENLNTLLKKKADKQNVKEQGH